MVCTSTLISFAIPAEANEDETIVCHAKTQHYKQLTTKEENELGLKMPRSGPEAFIAFRLPLKFISIQNSYEPCRARKLTTKFVLKKIKYGTANEMTLTLNMLVDGSSYIIKTKILGRYDPHTKHLKKTISGLDRYCGTLNTQPDIKFGLLHLPLLGTCGKAGTTFLGYPASKAEQDKLKVGRIRCKRTSFLKNGTCVMNLSYYNWPTKFSFPSKLLPKWKQVRAAAIDALDKKRVLLITSSLCIGVFCEKLGK